MMQRYDRAVNRKNGGESKISPSNPVVRAQRLQQRARRLLRGVFDKSIVSTLDPYPASLTSSFSGRWLMSRRSGVVSLHILYTRCPFDGECGCSRRGRKKIRMEYRYLGTKGYSYGTAAFEAARSSAQEARKTLVGYNFEGDCKRRMKILFMIPSPLSALSRGCSLVSFI